MDMSKVVALPAVLMFVSTCLWAEDSLDEYARRMVQPSVLIGSRNEAPVGGDCTKVSATTPTNELASFNASAGVLWPGALLQWKSLSSGQLADVPERHRAPLTFYIADAVALRPKPGQPALTPNIKRTVSDVKGSTVTQALTGLLQEQFFTPPNFFWTKVEAHSLEQALFEMGVDVRWLTASIQGSLKSSSYQERHNYLVRLTQQFYTVAVDPPSTPGGWFNKGVLGMPLFAGAKVSDLRSWSNPETNPITYIRSIVYGREVFLSISSTSSTSELDEALAASMNWALGGASTRLADKHKTVMQNSEIKLWVYGGGWDGIVKYNDSKTAAEAAVTLSSGDKLQEFAQYFKPSDKDDVFWGRPLSFRADFIGSGLPAATMLATEYTVCKPTPRLDTIAVRFQGWGEDKDHDSSLRVTIRDAAGNIYAEATDIGDTEKWDDRDKKGPYPLAVRKQMTRDAVAAGLFYEVCMSNKTNDTYKFHFTLGGVISRGLESSPTASWSAGQNNNSLKQNSCVGPWRLPALPQL